MLSVRGSVGPVVTVLPTDHTYVVRRYTETFGTDGSSRRVYLFVRRVLRLHGRGSAVTCLCWNARPYSATLHSYSFRAMRAANDRAMRTTGQWSRTTHSTTGSSMAWLRSSPSSGTRRYPLLSSNRSTRRPLVRLLPSMNPWLVAADCIKAAAFDAMVR